MSQPTDINFHTCYYRYVGSNLFTKSNGQIRSSTIPEEAPLLEAAYLSALMAGFISFISPCVLPLVPPYMCYMAGSSISQLHENIGEDANLRAKILTNSILFVLGFATVFIALGAGASSISVYIMVSAAATARYRRLTNGNNNRRPILMAATGPSGFAL